MSNHNLIFVAIFGLNTNSYFGRLYLLHIFTAFLNFIGNSVDNLKDHNDSTPLNTKELLHVRLFEVIINIVKLVILYPSFDQTF